jgi:DNA-binding NtrC family response regulator
MAAADIGISSHSPEVDGSAAPRLDALTTVARAHAAEADHRSSVEPSGPRKARVGFEGQDIATLFGDLVVDDTSSAGLITVDELERRYIQRVLAITAGNKSRAAQILGFDRRTLYRKIERYGRSM